MKNRTEQQTQPLMTVEEMAERLGVDRFTISRWINDPNAKKRLKCIKRGERYIRFTEQHLEEFLQRFDTQNSTKQKGTK